MLAHKHIPTRIQHLAYPLDVLTQIGIVQLVKHRTLNQFIVSAVAEKLSAMKTADYFTQRAQCGDINAVLAFLRRQGGQLPDEQDTLPFS